jgi:hypothetical protein
MLHTKNSLTTNCSSTAKDDKTGKRAKYLKKLIHELPRHFLTKNKMVIHEETKKDVVGAKKLHEFEVTLWVLLFRLRC